MLFTGDHLVCPSTDVHLPLFNSFPPGVHICAWVDRVSIGSDNGFVAYSAPSHYLKQCWDFVNWNLRKKLRRNFNQNKKHFIHENASENIVSEMAAILSRGKWVDIHVLMSSKMARDYACYRKASNRRPSITRTNNGPGNVTKIIWRPSATMS